MSEPRLPDALCRPPGRPRAMPHASRRQQILDAAIAVFSRKGYWATTMDDISREAGMSKKTIYQLFSSKADIFDLLLSSFAEPFKAPFAVEGRSQRTVFTEGLFRMAKAALDDRQLELVRVMIAEGVRSGDVADTIQRQKLCQGDWAMKDWLASQTSLGTRPVDDPERLAATLFWAVVGDFQITTLLRVRPPPTDAEIAEQVERVVALFF